MSGALSSLEMHRGRKLSLKQVCKVLRKKFPLAGEKELEEVAGFHVGLFGMEDLAIFTTSATLLIVSLAKFNPSLRVISFILILLVSLLYGGL